ncbi:unnamed protein product [Rotaria sp. Silwood2]|nr:unnamed protein product [Rotaria sp. Silwood2]
MAEAATPYFPQYIVKEGSKEQTREAMLADECDSCMTTTSILVNEQNVKRNSDKVVFNDGTAAGVLSNLKGCTRTMHLHEADVTLKSSGFMLPSPIDITPSRVDPFRSTLMTLHEKPGNFLRVLKKERIDVTGSKLNIFGASTGDLIAAELARQAASMATDALFERFILWPIDGQPIPNEDCIPCIDFSQYPSLEQFGVLCGFFSNLNLDLEPEGRAILAEQSFNFRVAGSQEGVKDNVSARLNKTALVCYRLTGLCALVEAAFDMVAEYVEEYVTFGAGEADEVFFHRATKIAERKYGPIIRKEQRLMVDANICKRAHDVTVQNLAQYMTLMKIQEEDKKNWFTQAGRTMKAMMRFITPEDSTELAESKNTNEVLVNNGHKIGWPLTRKQENMLRKADIYKVSILLHPSLVFIKSSLYANSSLKKTTSILETSFIKPLVTDGYLVAISNGLVYQKTKATVYIKMVPTADEESKETFSTRLASFRDARLNYDTYLASCSNISFYSAGVISEKVFEILRLERYRSLNIDISSLVQRVSHETQNENLIDDESNSSASQLVVVNEEIVEQQSEIIGVETIMVSISQNSETKRKTTNHKEILDEQLSQNEKFSETIAERIRNRQRKRVKTSAK